MTISLNRRNFIKDSYLSVASVVLLSPLTACAAQDKKTGNTSVNEENTLFKKVYGALIGAAVGDAMGGPVEFWHHKDIEKKYGILDKLVGAPVAPEVSEQEAVTDEVAADAGSKSRPDEQLLSKLAGSSETQQPGIAAADMEKIFNPFFTTDPQGTGLGLAICRRILNAHGGDISMTNGEAGGAVVRIALPLPEDS